MRVRCTIVGTCLGGLAAFAMSQSPDAIIFMVAVGLVMGNLLDGMLSLFDDLAVNDPKSDPS